MGAYTMPDTVFNQLAPAGGEPAADYLLVPAACASLTVNWTADRLVTFRGYLRNITQNGAKTAFQSFFANNGGSWSGTPAFNGSDAWAFGIDSVTTTGVITLTFLTSNGRPYACIWSPNLGKFVAAQDPASGKFWSAYFWNGTSWRLMHS